jgi:hypothetical protein
MILVEDQALSMARLTDEHPEVLEIHPICPIDDEISPFQRSLILLSLIHIEMVRDGSTPE